MKMKKEYIILAVIIIGLSLYITVHKSDNVHYSIPKMEIVPQKDITEIEISKKNESITLKRQDDKWMIGPESYPADPEKINKILDILDDLSLTALVSESENYVRYDLSENQRIHVRAFKGNSLKRELDIGKTAPSFRHTFVKIDKDPNVYLALENFRSHFEQSVDGLRDKTVLSFDRNEIQGISIIKGNQSLAFSKKQAPIETKPDKESKEEKMDERPETTTTWQDGEGKTVELSKINSLFSFLSDLECKRYLSGKKEDLKKPLYTVHLRGIEEKSLSIYSKETDKSEEYPAISSLNPYVFVLENSKAESIMSVFENKKAGALP